MHNEHFRTKNLRKHLINIWCFHQLLLLLINVLSANKVLLPGLIAGTFNENGEPHDANFAVTFGTADRHYGNLWASYQIRKIAGCACAGNAGKVFPRRRFQRKPLVSDPGMHHGTCVTHVPWCMSGSLTCGDGENVPGIPRACAPAILRIWQEAHGATISGKVDIVMTSGFQCYSVLS